MPCDRFRSCAAQPRPKASQIGCLPRSFCGPNQNYDIKFHVGEVHCQRPSAAVTHIQTEPKVSPSITRGTRARALRFRRSESLFEQRDALDMMRHREGRDGAERERDPSRAAALRRRTQPLTCADAAPRTARAGTVLRGFANQTEPNPSPPVSGLRRSQTTAAHRGGTHHRDRAAPG